MSLTIISALEAIVREAPQKTALLSDDTKMSYEALWTSATKLAGGLSTLGLERSEPVVVMLDNHPEHVVTWFGLAMGGYIDVPLNTALKGGLLEYQISQSGAATVIIEDQYLPRLAAALVAAPVVTKVIVRGTASVPAGWPSAVATFRMDEVVSSAIPLILPAEPWDLLAIMYTSGTTGPSKGALCTHGQAMTYADPAWWGGADRADVDLVTLPLFHLGGMWMGVLNAIRAGATIALPPRFSAGAFWDEVRRYRASYVVLVGAICNILMRQPRSPRDRDHTLRRMFMVPVIDEAGEFEERFNVSLGTGFGQTEASGFLGAPFGKARPRSCGWLRPGFEVRIVDEHDLPVEDGSVGELVVRSAEPWQLSLGYHRMPEKTIELFRNQWLHTGDAMYRTEEGEYVFVDRKNDAIRRRGENVSSFEVEAEVNKFPAVLECAAVGVESELSEEEIKIAVVLKPGQKTTPEELTQYLVGRLPYFMVPRYIEFVAALPRSATDKIQKAALRASGVTATTWDREAAGIKVTRQS